MRPDFLSLFLTERLEWLGHKSVANSLESQNAFDAFNGTRAAATGAVNRRADTHNYLMKNLNSFAFTCCGGLPEPDVESWE